MSKGRMKRAMLENQRRMREENEILYGRPGARSEPRGVIVAPPVRRPWHVEGVGAFATREEAERVLWIGQLAHSARVLIGTMGYSRVQIAGVLTFKYGNAIASAVLEEVDRRGPMTREDVAEEIMCAIREELKRETRADEDANANTIPPPVRP